MCKTEELLILMDLDKELKKFDYDKVNLMNLDPLRIEVKRRLNQLSRKSAWFMLSIIRQCFGLDNDQN